MNDIAYSKVAVRPIDRLKDAGGVMGDQYWLFVGIVFVGFIIGNAVPIILIGPMMCGVFKCYLERLQGRPTTFETLFRGFDYFLESLIVAVILSVAIVVILLPFLCLIGGMSAVAGGNGQGGGAMPLLMFLLIAVMVLALTVVAMVLNIVFYFAFLLIVDRGAKAVPAVKAAFGATLANIGGLTGFAIISTLISGLAVLCCYLPVFLVLPYVVGALTLIYRDIFSAKPVTPFGTTSGYPPGAPKPPPIQ